MKNNNKHFSTSDKLNKIIKLILCDATLQRRNKYIVPSFWWHKLCKHVRAEEENAFIVFNSFSLRKNNKGSSLKRQLEWVVILVINIAIAQIVIPIQSLPSGAGFYACEVCKTCMMGIQKKIMLVVWYKILHFLVGKMVVSGVFHCRYIISTKISCAGSYVLASHQWNFPWSYIQWSQNGSLYILSVIG